MNPITKTTVWILFFAWSIDYIDRLVINIALPLIGEDLELSHSQRGLVISAFFLAYAAAQLPGGLLADKFGAVRMATIGLLAWSIFTGLTAFAFSLASLLAIRIGFGLAQGLFPGAAMKLLAERSLPAERMTANGWMQSSNAIGALAAAVIAAIALPLLGWRGMFLVIAGLGLVMLVVMRRRMPAPMSPESTGAEVSATEAAPITIRDVLRSRAMWAFAAMFFGYDVLVWGLNSWFPSYLHEERGISLSAASLLGIFPTLAAAAAIILSGRWCDRLDGRPRPLVLPALIAGIIGVVLVPHIGSVIGIVAFGTVMVAVVNLAYMPTFALALRNLPTQVAGIGSGIILVGGMLGGVIAPSAFGWIVDILSWEWAFASLAIGPIIGIIALYLAPRDATEFRAALRLPTLPRTVASSV
ncbi:MAG: transporter [Rhodococcus erythropolis]|nr:transporter [Rhodococcus erythropolis]